MAGHGRTTRLSPWARLVAVCAVLVVGGLAAAGIGAWTSSETRIAEFSVRGQLQGIVFDVGDADVTVRRAPTGRRSVGVERTDRFAFSHEAKITRSVSGGVFYLRSRCPRTVLNTCEVSFGIVVPDNVPVTVRTSSGTVDVFGYRGQARIATDSGDVHVRGFCGFLLEARTETGDVDATASCAPQRMALRSRTGSVHAVVPPGRYEVDADTAAGRRTVRGVLAASESPFAIQALSSAGDVSVETAP